MVFLIFLASVVALEWIVRRGPAPPHRRRRIEDSSDDIDMDQMTESASADIARLANALAERGPGSANELGSGQRTPADSRLRAQR